MISPDDPPGRSDFADFEDRKDVEPIGLEADGLKGSSSSSGSDSSGAFR